MSQPDISVIIVNWNTSELLLKCLASLPWQSRELKLEVIVVDNASTDNSAGLVEMTFPRCTVIRNALNLGFAAGNNIGMRVAEGRYCALINSDVEVLPGCLEKLVAYADEHENIGILAPGIRWPDGRRQDTCRRFPNLWNNFCQASGLRKLFPGHAFFSGEHMFYFGHDRTMPVDYLNGCFLLVRQAMIYEIGMMDERFFMYAEEVDWCRRARDAGWEVVYYPGAEAIHLGRASSSREPSRFAVEQQRALLQYWQKHHSALEVAAYRLISGGQWLMRFMRYAVRYGLQRNHRTVLGPCLRTSWQAMRTAAAPIPRAGT